jgi:hypothetical protein
MGDLQDFRTGLRSAAQGVTGGGWTLASGRVFFGYSAPTRTTGSGFWADCVSGESGAAAFVRFGGVSSDGDYRSRNATPTFDCTVDVYCALDKDTAINGSGVTVFVESIRKALHAAMSGGCTYDPPEFHILGPVALLHWSLRCEGIGCGS